MNVISERFVSRHALTNQSTPSLTNRSVTLGNGNARFR